MVAAVQSTADSPQLVTVSAELMEPDGSTAGAGATRRLAPVASTSSHGPAAGASSSSQPVRGRRRPSTAVGLRATASATLAVGIALKSSDSSRASSVASSAGWVLSARGSVLAMSVTTEVPVVPVGPVPRPARVSWPRDAPEQPAARRTPPKMVAASTVRRVRASLRVSGAGGGPSGGGAGGVPAGVHGVSLSRCGWCGHPSRAAPAAHLAITPRNPRPPWPPPNDGNQQYGTVRLMPFIRGDAEPGGNDGYWQYGTVLPVPFIGGVGPASPTHHVRSARLPLRPPGAM